MTPARLTATAISIPLGATDSAFRDLWNETLSQSCYDHLHQSYEWAVLKGQFGWEAEFMALLKHGKPAVGALLLTKPIAGGLFRLATVPGGPFWLPGEEKELPHLLALLAEYCQRKRAIFCRIHIPCPVQHFERVAPHFPPSCFRLPHVWTYWNTPRPIMELDIRGTVEDILALMQRKTRYRYRTALRRGVTVTEGSSAELTEFGRLIREMGQRKQIPVRDQKHFDAILKVFGPGRAALLIARHECRVVGGQIVVRAGRRAYALYAAVERAGNLNPSEVLDVASIEWAKQKGCVTLDLGGTCTNWPPSPEDKGYGVYDYKRRLGARIVLLGPYVDIAVSPTMYRLARLVEELALPLLLEKTGNKFIVLAHRFKERHFHKDQVQWYRGDA